MDDLEDDFELVMYSEPSKKEQETTTCVDHESSPRQTSLSSRMYCSPGCPMQSADAWHVVDLENLDEDIVDDVMLDISEVEQSHRLW